MIMVARLLTTEIRCHQSAGTFRREIPITGFLIAGEVINIIGTPESFNMNISHQVFDYTINLVN